MHELRNNSISPQESNIHQEPNIPQESNIKESISKLLPPFLSDRYEGIAVVIESAVESIYIVRQVLLDHSMELHIAHSGSDEKMRRELQTKAKTRSSLVHASIPAVHDFGLCLNGDPFMIIELPAGQCLDSLVASAETIPVENAVFIASELAGAMQLLEDQELRYGRFKIEQIVVASDGVPAIINLGFPICDSKQQVSLATDSVRFVGFILLAMLNGTPKGATLFDTGAFSSKCFFVERTDLPEYANELRSLLERTILTKQHLSLRQLHAALVAILKRSNSCASRQPSDTKAPFLILGVLTIFALTVSIIASCLMPRIDAPKILIVPPPPVQSVLTPKSLGSDNHLVGRSLSQVEKDGRLVLRDLSIDDRGIHLLKSINIPITKLDMSDTQISDVSITYISHFPLLFLDVTRTNITDIGLKQICDHCPQIVNLRIGNTKVSVKGLEYLSALKDLQGLNLYNNRLSDDAMTPIAKLVRLQKIDLENNPGITDHGLAMLNKRSRLKNINLTGTAVTDSGMVALLKLKYLDTLYLGNSSSITDEALKTLVRHRHLKRITLRRTKVSERGLRILLNSRSLVELNLPGMNVSESTRNAFLKLRPDFELTTMIMSKLQQ